MLDMCGVGVEATWTACEAVATAWTCQQGGVVLRQERLDRRVTCGLCHGCECVYPHVCCRVRLCSVAMTPVCIAHSCRLAATTISNRCFDCCVRRHWCVSRHLCRRARGACVSSLSCALAAVGVCGSYCRCDTVATKAPRCCVSWRRHRSSSRLLTVLRCCRRVRCVDDTVSRSAMVQVLVVTACLCVVAQVSSRRVYLASVLLCVQCACRCEAVGVQCMWRRDCGVAGA
jgi:hypothetical protein